MNDNENLSIEQLIIKLKDNTDFIKLNDIQENAIKQHLIFMLDFIEIIRKMKVNKNE